MAKTLLRLKERLAQPPADLGGVGELKARSAAAEPLRWITVQRGHELQLITVEVVAYFRANRPETLEVSPAGAHRFKQL